MADKAQELKKVLESKMAKDEIESKLKKEKEKLDEKNQKQKEKQTKIFYILLSIVLLLLIVLLYTFFKQTNTKPDIQKQEIKTITKEKPNKKPETKNIIEEKTEAKLEKTETQEAKLEKTETQETIIKNEKPKIKEKVIIKEKIIETSKTNFSQLFNSKKYNLAKCYNYKATYTKPTKECKTILKEFLEKNKKALRFEIIGVVGKSDIKKIQSLNDNKKIQEYILRGVSRDRVVESSWLVKELLGSNTLLTPVNYYITSKKDNKGIVIRAYY